MPSRLGPGQEAAQRLADALRAELGMVQGARSADEWSLSHVRTRRENRECAVTAMLIPARSPSASSSAAPRNFSTSSSTPSRRSWCFRSSSSRIVDPLTGTLYSFAIFALAFVARPIGTVIFMAVDRAYGRGVKLTIALFLLGSSTVAIAFLPGYDADRLGVGGLAARAVPHRPGPRARRRMGRACLAARAQRAEQRARLVRDDPAARRAARA